MILGLFIVPPYHLNTNTFNSQVMVVVTEFKRNNDMARTFKYLVLARLPIAALVFFLYANSYTKFRPTVLDRRSDFQYSPRDTSETFWQNLRIVLDGYTVQYTVSEDGDILIRRKVCWDEEYYGITQQERATVLGWPNIECAPKRPFEF